MKLRRGVAGIVAGVLLAGEILQFSGFSYADEIGDAETERKRLEERKEEAEQELASLKSEKDDLLKGIEKLDKKMEEVNQKLESVQKDCEVADSEYEALKVELATAQQTEADQYDTMKKRLKYMYENGTEGYFEIIMDAGSLSETFERIEYVNKITAYDNTMLKNYESAKDEVARRTEEAAAKREQLSVLQQEVKLEQNNLQKIADVKKERLEQYEDTIDSKSKEASKYQKMIEKKEAEIDQLLLEEAMKNQQEGAASGTLISSEAGLIWPLPSAGTITSHYGKRTAPTAGASTFHKGIDIAISTGTDIYAAADGVVTTATYSSSAGNYVMINHGDGLYTAYMHASRLCCKVGDRVLQGDKIAEVGSTGISTGSHLHFSVIINGAYVDPEESVIQP